VSLCIVDGATIEGDRQKARIRVALVASGRENMFSIYFFPVFHFCNKTKIQSCAMFAEEIDIILPQFHYTFIEKLQKLCVSF
jgi:hypothetical protein